MNFLIRGCGIAQATKKIVLALEGTTTKVLHTRKTAPGLRHFDVYACLVGGAHKHRLDLSDAILVKENHLRTSSSWQALFDGIKKYRSEARFVEIEVTNLQELKQAIAVKPDRIMLDNFTVEQTAKACELFGSSVELEASGGINECNARHYAESGVDYISMGSLTHSSPAADLSMLFEFNE